jgi:hypothetical protein
MRAICSGTNSIGFIPPLPSGDYSFWIQEGFNGTFPYNFELVLCSVPAPPTILLVALAGLAMGLRRHRGATGRGRSRAVTVDARS